MDYKKVIELTPEPYREFVTSIVRTNFKTKVTTNSGHMRAEGRILMMNDEQREVGEKPKITYSRYEMNGLWFITCHLECNRGSAEGDSQIRFGGSEADRTHPLESAQTKSLARACGYLGYGIAGGASFEELVEALNEQDRLDEREVPNMSKPPEINRATERQIAFLRNTLEKLNYGPSLIDETIAKYEYSSQEMSMALDRFRDEVERGAPQKVEGSTDRATQDQIDKCMDLLKALDFLPSQAEQEMSKYLGDRGAMAEEIKRLDLLLKETARRAFERRQFWDKMTKALKTSGKTRDDLKEFMASTIGVESTDKLSDDEKQLCLDWAAEPVSEHPKANALDDPWGSVIPTNGMAQEWDSVVRLCHARGVDVNTLVDFVCAAEGVEQVWQLSQSGIVRTMTQLSIPQIGRQLMVDIEKWVKAKEVKNG